MKKITVFCGATYPEKHEQHYFDLAYKTGKLIAQAGHIAITGAGPGLMDAVLQGASESGGETIGVCLESDGQAYSKHAKERLMFDKLGIRQDKMIEMADAYIALPGGLGTVYEIFNIIALKRIGEMSWNKPLVLIGAEYYAPVMELVAQIVKTGFVNDVVLESFALVDRPEAAIALISQTQ